MTDPAIIRFRALVAAGLAALEERRQEVNDLNVFPVADGDTGDNMVLTLRAVLSELDRLASASDGRSIDEIGREEIVASVARAALLGARGNSGVILSQLIRGAAEELASRPGEMIDPMLIGAALARAADQAYGSVREPAEGTILTVAREMAHRIASEIAHMEDARLAPGATNGDQDRVAADVLEAALETGQESVRRGPDILPVLRDAGVVDAGGYGLTVLLSGIAGALRGEQALDLDHHGPARVTHPQHASATFRYCTNFAVTGAHLDQRQFAAELERIGDSVLVVGDATTLKVHVHTDDPDAATGLFHDHGTVSHIDIADMSEQVRDRDARLSAQQASDGDPVCGALAVVTGAGITALFEQLGTVTLDGGKTLNPSTYDLLAAIHAVPAEEVVVLPNSSNVWMAAERAAELSDKQVVVLPTRSQQAGLAVAVGLDPARQAADNAEAMAELLASVRTGAVAQAARDDPQGRFRTGDAIGFVEEELVAWGSVDETLERVISTLGDGAELVTCLHGEGAPLDESGVRRLVDSDRFELELSYGGQDSYWWLVAAE
ncbi:DAK2 domain-containing protein [Conexibacter sp. DBS9H8]|uniref:DAK2 domain-containing protein n=1 Tax=Conexibacter sp. DBS9H8 TaxID=2937801 RepID=UPI0020107DFF|nr:DAK2 domain-containing protein [Conexibacter sp. DBS9H8]